MQDRWTQVDAYICDRMISDEPALNGVLDRNRAAGLPAQDVAPNQGMLIHLYARMVQARRILELGTLGGYSTIWLALALPEDGRVTTIEANPAHAAVARQNFARAGLEQQIDLLEGNALEVLSKHYAEHPEPYDLIFLDADKQHAAEYFEWAMRFSRPGTLIVADNVVRDGEVINADSADDRIRGIRRFFDAVAQTPRVRATAIQTVGSKGYDGFSLILVTA